MEQDYLLDKKIEYLINMKVGKLQNQLNDALSQVGSMAEEMQILKNKVQRLNLGVPPQTKLAGEDAKVEAKKEEPNSRTGNFNPDDVSVEKMFYFGKN